MLLHIIYLRTGEVLVSRQPYESWQEIQAAYPEFMTSLGPWAEEAVVDYLDAEYSFLSPDARVQIEPLVLARAEVVTLTFSD